MRFAGGVAHREEIHLSVDAHARPDRAHAEPRPFDLLVIDDLSKLRTHVAEVLCHGVACS